MAVLKGGFASAFQPSCTFIVICDFFLHQPKSVHLQVLIAVILSALGVLMQGSLGKHGKVRCHLPMYREGAS